MSRVHVIVAEEGGQAFRLLGRWVFSGPEPERLDIGSELLAEAFVSRLAKHLHRMNHPACRVTEPIREASALPLLECGGAEGTTQEAGA